MRLLLIEDEVDLVNAIVKGLRREGYAVDSALNGEDGLLLADLNSYDLLILDLNLPGIDGLEICRRLRARQPALLILMLTARSRPLQRVQGLDLGADDYLTKPFHFAELLARLRALLRRPVVPAGTPGYHNGDLRLDPITQQAWQGARALALTAKEFAVLAYLLRHVGAVVPQETLLEHIWDSHANPFTNVVRVHINALRRKLGDDAQTPRYIETVVGRGYRLRRLPEEAAQ